MIILLFICLSSLLLSIPLIILYKLWLIPFRIQLELESQGIKGPPYKFIYGNTKEIIQMKKQISSTPMDLSHDIFPRLQPHLYSWSKIYGDVFVFWMGAKPFVVVMEDRMIKEILSNKEGKCTKLKIEGYLQKLVGDGIVVAEGEKWSKLRRLANHAFHGDCLKDMVPEMISSARTMVDRWMNYEGKEIEVCEQFRLLTSEVISRTAFGSSYLEGIMIFETLTKLKLIQTEDDIEADRIEKQLRVSILEIVKKREAEASKGQVNDFGSDFLGSLLKVHHDMDPKNRVSVDEIIDECKTFYFGGQETTYSLLCWSILLLGIHTDWQEEARKELIQLFGQENPNSEGIARLKTVTMIIYETLRLYSPVTTITRRTERKTKLGKYQLPANVNLLILPQALHRNPETWGQDAHLFKPERFSEGLAKSTNGNSVAFLPFGSGPRMCVGMNFAFNEAKIALSMILQRYKFTISPNYVHSPNIVLTMQPQHGVQILLQRL
ncbi:cytochrome P450 CYP749A22-like isoform X2 [Henckelia pumila]|uniref:cytochrome P450 CYP749A22-like isoform X2 n=1 Tax=Henckelia pumila TaxID=405737 RepID=UPI003C6DED0D